MTTEAVRATSSEETTFPYKRKCPFSMPAEYGPLMEQASVFTVKLITGLEVWAVTGYENMKKLLGICTA